jgi:hypothetical protein
VDKKAYLAVGIVPEWYGGHTGGLDFLAVVRLPQIPNLATEQTGIRRQFYALVVEDGLLRPYKVLVSSIYFFSEFRVAGDSSGSQMRQWPTRVDEAVGKHSRDRDPVHQKGMEAGEAIPGYITTARLAHMKKMISNLKKGSSSVAFRFPVDPAALGILEYFDIVKEPMDLGTIDEKLKSKQYNTIECFKKDFDLVVNNAYLFLGRDHAVSMAAARMETGFNIHWNMLPSASFPKPAKALAKDPAHGNVISRIVPPRRADRTREASTVLPARIGDTANAVIAEAAMDTAMSQARAEQVSTMPPCKRQRIGSKAQAGLRLTGPRTEMGAFAAAEELRSNQLLALINQAATPQTLIGMNDMYQHSFGTEETRAMAAFAQALQQVTAAISTGRKERAAMLEEISDVAAGGEEDH